jgi:hypothetical protein
MQAQTLEHGAVESPTLAADLDPAARAPVVLAPASASLSTPSQMIAYAMASGSANLDQLERLYALQQRYEADQARKAFHAALAAFKAEGVTIHKDKRVAYESKNGGADTSYYHATLGNIVGVVAPALGRFRLSHGWSVARNGDRVSVTCTVSHADGYNESVTLDGPLDSSGGKNSIQAVGSSISYLERYTLMAILGLAAIDQDNDGSDAPGLEKITAAQEAELRAIMDQAGASIAKLAKYMEVARLADIPAIGFERALSAANAKLREAQKRREGDAELANKVRQRGAEHAGDSAGGEA